MRARRSPAFNTLIVGVIFLIFLIAGAVVWFSWSAGSRTALDDSFPAALPWAFVLIGGPAILLLAFIWSKARNRKVTRASDPDTPGDDASRGMTGHDRTV
jgi:membrane protein implicated in regulation of membrane protease activity